MGIDPVGVDENNVHSHNRYAYANNNPYKFVDPDGRAAVLLPYLIGAYESLQVSAGLFLTSTAGQVTMAVAAGEAGIVMAGPAAKTAISGAARLGINKAAGEAGEAISRANLGGNIAGEKVTIITSTGKRTVTDFVTKNEGIIETKTGNAVLSKGQKQLQSDVKNGIPVIPVGKNAKEAGLRPGTPTTFKDFKVDRH